MCTLYKPLYTCIQNYVDVQRLFKTTSLLQFETVGGQSISWAGANVYPGAYVYNLGMPAIVPWFWVHQPVACNATELQRRTVVSQG